MSPSGERTFTYVHQMDERTFTYVHQMETRNTSTLLQEYYKETH